MPQKMSIMHDTSKRLWARPFGTKAAGTDRALGHTAGTVCRLPLGGTISLPVVLTERLGGLNGHRLNILPARKPFAYPKPVGRPFVPRPWDGRGSKQRPRSNVVRNSSPMAQWQC
jgi:hypothetical protein